MNPCKKITNFLSKNKNRFQKYCNTRRMNPPLQHIKTDLKKLILFGLSLESFGALWKTFGGC